MFLKITQKLKGFDLDIYLNLIKDRIRELEEQQDFLKNRLSMQPSTSIEYGITSRKLDAVEELLEVNFVVLSDIFDTGLTTKTPQ